jgi:hypothetical protein
MCDEASHCCARTLLLTRPRLRTGHWLLLLLIGPLMVRFVVRMMSWLGKSSSRTDTSWEMMPRVTELSVRTAARSAPLAMTLTLGSPLGAAAVGCAPAMAQKWPRNRSTARLLPRQELAMPMLGREGAEHDP